MGSEGSPALLTTENPATGQGGGDGGPVGQGCSWRDKHRRFLRAPQARKV